MLHVQQSWSEKSKRPDSKMRIFRNWCLWNCQIETEFVFTGYVCIVFWVLFSYFHQYGGIKRIRNPNPNPEALTPNALMVSLKDFGKTYSVHSIVRAIIFSTNFLHYAILSVLKILNNSIDSRAIFFFFFHGRIQTHKLQREILCYSFPWVLMAFH